MTDADQSGDNDLTSVASLRPVIGISGIRSAVVAYVLDGGRKDGRMHSYAGQGALKNSIRFHGVIDGDTLTGEFQAGMGEPGRLSFERHQRRWKRRLELRRAALADGENQP